MTLHLKNYAITAQISKTNITARVYNPVGKLQFHCPLHT